MIQAVYLACDDLSENLLESFTETSTRPVQVQAYPYSVFALRTDNLAAKKKAILQKHGKKIEM